MTLVTLGLPPRSSTGKIARCVECPAVNKLGCTASKIDLKFCAYTEEDERERVNPVERHGLSFELFSVASGIVLPSH